MDGDPQFKVVQKWTPWLLLVFVPLVGFLVWIVTKPAATERGEVVATTSTRAPFPTALVIPYIEILDGLPVTEGVPVRVSLGIKKSGPGLVRNAKFAALLSSGAIYLVPEISKQIEAAFNHLDLNPKDPQSLSEDEGLIYISKMWNLSKETTKKVQDRKEFLYVFMRYQWEDPSGLHTGEACRFLNSPLPQGPKKTGLWGLCPKHNQVN